jgi:formate-dependent nitrite reductase membrane component NrfD
LQEQVQMPAVLGLVAVALGLASILADEHISRRVWRTAEDPQAGATSVRVMGLILFVAGGLAFLAWKP